jgi:hypothetical protein
VASTAERIKERKLNRMRLGQAVCEFVPLPSDPEIRVAIVPLTEAEYLKVLNEVNAVDAGDDLAGVSIKDRVTAQQTLVWAIREPEDLAKRVYVDNEEETAMEQLLETLEVGDIDEIIDRYNEMCEQSSPSLDGIPEEELENIKKALQKMDWNDLSGGAWYAAKRFLSRIMPSPLLDNSLGSTSISYSTTTNDSDESTPGADQSSSEQTAKSVTNQ